MMTKEQALQKIKELQEYINNQESVIQEIPAKKLEWGATCEKELNWEEATKWCKEQGEGWRLPTQIELLQAYEDNIKDFGTSNYWSATEFNSDFARLVYFYGGDAFSNYKTSNYYVRCVRGW